MCLEVFPHHKSCWLCRELVLCITLFFIFPLFLCFFDLEIQNLLLSVLSVLSCFFCFLCFPSHSFLLFFLVFLVLFSPSVYSLYFLISLIVFFSNHVILSFLFSNYSILLFGKDQWHFLCCVPFFLSLFSLALFSISVLLMLPFCFCFYSFTFAVLLSSHFCMLLQFSYYWLTIFLVYFCYFYY